MPFRVMCKLFLTGSFLSLQIASVCFVHASDLSATGQQLSDAEAQEVHGMFSPIPISASRKNMSQLLPRKQTPNIENNDRDSASVTGSTWSFCSGYPQSCDVTSFIAVNPITLERLQAIVLTSASGEMSKEGLTDVCEQVMFDASETDAIYTWLSEYLKANRNDQNAQFIFNALEVNLCKVSNRSLAGSLMGDDEGELDDWDKWADDQEMTPRETDFVTVEASESYDYLNKRPAHEPLSPWRLTSLNESMLASLPREVDSQVPSEESERNSLEKELVVLQAVLNGPVAQGEEPMAATMLQEANVQISKHASEQDFSEESTIRLKVQAMLSEIVAQVEERSRPLQAQEAFSSNMFNQHKAALAGTLLTEWSTGFCRGKASRKDLVKAWGTRGCTGAPMVVNTLSRPAKKTGQRAKGKTGLSTIEEISE